MKVVINKIEPQTVELYNPQDELIGAVNEYEFNDVRIQIKEHSLEGYYLLFNDRRIFINTNGCCDEYPKGFFDTLTEQWVKLLKLQRNA